MRRRVKKFFQTPKGLVTIILLILAVMAAPGQGVRAVMVGLASATIAAGLVDALIILFRKHVWEFPSGAVLTAMIVAMVLRAQEPWYVTASTSVAAVLSKYIFRSRSANVFNPAALALIASFYVFHTGQSWWGALPDIFPILKVMLLAAGVFITDRVNKAPLVLTFLGTYFALFTVTAFVSNPAVGCRDISNSRLRGGVVFRVHHPDRSTDIAREVSRPDCVRGDRGGGQLCVLPMGRRGLLSASGGTCR